MPRTCFVIMPFSETKSCRKEQWTWIFEEVFKKAVESAGLDYKCKRSQSTTGNIVADIVRDLNSSDVVPADLTDHNPNVFYELGVRHALRHCTILVAQRIDDIPFDLRNYACHIYDWKSQDARDAFSYSLKEVLQAIDNYPTRPDNPVSDFLHRFPAGVSSEQQSRKKVVTSVPNEKYHFPDFQGVITFNYDNNDGHYWIGQGEFLFETEWSHAGDTEIYAYNDPESIDSIALLTGNMEIKDVVMAKSYDYSSRARSAEIGDIVIWRNAQGFYAATKVIDVKSRNGDDPTYELTIEYIIQTDGSDNFSRSK